MDYNSMCARLTRVVDAGTRNRLGQPSIAANADDDNIVDEGSARVAVTEITTD